MGVLLEVTRFASLYVYVSAVSDCSILHPSFHNASDSRRGAVRNSDAAASGLW